MEAFSILLDAVIKEALDGIVRKIREGKKLTDSEVLLLVVSQLRREQELLREAFNDFKRDVYRRFDDIDRRFDEVDRKFDEVYQRFEQVDRRFEQVDKRFEQIDRRFEQVDKRFEQLEAEIKFMSHELMGIKSDIINLLKEKL